MDDEILDEFVLESTEALDALDVELVVLEGAPADTDTLSSIFRRVHTIKGTCGFLGFGRLERITHVAETLLSRLRDGELTATPEIIGALLRLVDAVRGILAQVVLDGTEGTDDHDQLVEDLTALANASAPETEQRPAPLPVVPAPVVEAAAPPAPAATPDVQPDPAPATAPTTATETTVRVDVGALDELMDLVGELVLNRNALLDQAAGKDAALTGTLQRLDALTSELQGSVARTRMQPIEQLWSKYPRVVRDLARQCDKTVELVVQGGSTELDKAVLDAVRDPLAHLVRNAIDHGLEPPGERIARGKPAAGTVTLHAFHEAGQVVIDVSDDGGGVDPAAVGALAVERGLVRAGDLAAMSDAAITELLFAPGFSTADAITRVSGRGVGMDVVRTDVERLGGHVELSSELGVGTTVRIRMPLTLAIIPALLVGVADERYAIPQAALVELHRARPGELALVHQTPVLRLRGELVPVVHLARVLHGPDTPADGDHVVLVRAGDRSFGLVVDAVHDTAEVVVKPLGPQLRDLPVYAGATVTGDGAVVLLLDAAGIATTAGVTSPPAAPAPAPAVDESAVTPDNGATEQSLVLFRLADEHRFAIPLDRVTRLEEFAPGDVERSGIHDVVQRGASILPLLHLGDVLPGGRRPVTSDDAPLRTIVYRRAGGEIGLVVGQVDDVVHRDIAVRRALDVPGLSGSAVIDGVVTDVVDVDDVLDRLGLLTAPA